MSPSSSAAVSSGRRWATSRNRSISASSSTPSASVRNLRDVVLARERPRAERMRVGDGDLVDDASCRRSSVISTRPPNAFSAGSSRVVAARPLRVLDRGDLVPQLDGVRRGRRARASRRSSWSQAPSCSATAKMYGIEWSSVSRLAVGSYFCGSFGARADHVVRVVAGVPARSCRRSPGLAARDARCPACARGRSRPAPGTRPSAPSCRCRGSRAWPRRPRAAAPRSEPSGPSSSQAITPSSPS